MPKRILFALLLAGLVRAEQRGSLQLYFLQLPVGQENWLIDDSHILHADFHYHERGSDVRLGATLHIRPDGTPLDFQAQGNNYRPFHVDASVTVEGATATIREGEHTRSAKVPERYFTIAGYAPLSAQMLMLQYWRAHGKPARLATFPGDGVTIEQSGVDTVEAAGQKVRLTRFAIGGVVWGKETIWMDDHDQIAAASTFAGNLPLEAVREEYKDALPQLIHSANQDRFRELTALSKQIRPAMQGSFAITGVRLIDGVGTSAIENATVIVREGRIAQAGANVATPSGMPVIDGRGQTLLPGLWEMHAHFAQVEYGPAYLAAGVTSARDCGDEFEFITGVRDLIDQGALGPRLLLAGLVDRSGEGTFGVDWADSPEQGRAMVAKYHAAGFAQMKIYNRIQLDTLRAITDEAHRDGMTVTGHIPEGMTAMDGVNAGMDQINHFGPVLQAIHKAGPEHEAEVVQFFKEHRTVIDPTLAWGELLGRPTNVPIESFEPGFAKAPYTLTSMIGMSGSAPGAMKRPTESFRVLRELYAAGIPIVAGTDKAVPAHSLHRELELYVEAGLTPMQVIQIATSGAARAMGVEKEVGAIEPGKRADMVLVDGNPLEHFADLRKVRRVITYGRVYDPGPLWKSVGFRP